MNKILLIPQLLIIFILLGCEKERDLEEQAKALTEKIDQQQIIINQLTSSLDLKNNNIEDLQKKIETQNATSADLTSNLEEMSLKLDSQLKNSGELSSKNTNLEKEIEILKTEIDELRFGAKRLLERIQQEFTSKNYDGALSLIEIIGKKHPDSEEHAIAKKTKDKIDSILEEEKDRKNKELKSALAGMRSNHDDMQGVTWYESPSQSKEFNMYIGRTNDGNVLPRFRVYARSDDWLFPRAATLNIDGTLFQIPIKNRKSNMISGLRYSNLEEWSDQFISEDELKVFEKIASTKSDVKIRLVGDTRNKDFTLSKDAKSSISQAYKTYLILKEAQSD